MMQHIANVNGYWVGDKSRNNPGYEASYFERAYDEQVKYIVDAVELTRGNAERTNLHNVARITKAMIFHRLTDIYGDVPYSQAGLGYYQHIYTPQYDAQADIYADLLKELEEAGNALDVNGDVIKGDMIFNGDIAKWKKIANSLMLRLGFRLLKQNEALAKQWVEKAASRGVMAGNADNAFILHDASSDRLTPCRNSIVMNLPYEIWKTGVTLADVDADGWLDIYLSYSGRGDDDSRRNQLFINNHDLTFTEQAKKFGLDDPGYGTQAAFFDFDRDGDLDCFILNHNIRAFRNFENEALRNTRDPLAGDKLLENRGGHFYDISERAGISASPLGFGLGLAVSDIDGDGWPDLYVNNDYNEPDYLYINNQHGGFRNMADSMLGHISQFSMGCDVADFNNDGRPDILTLDMLPEDNRRQKLLQGPENYEAYELMVKTGLHHQLMRNMLHLNMGPTGAGPSTVFSEIGQLAGVSNTDWSWSGLFADFDNDGWKDILITNGYLRDYTNRDFMRYWGDYLIKKAAAAEPPSLLELVRKMPATRLKNYLFRNDGADAEGHARLTFTNMTDAWGAGLPAVSNGATYSDLDGDGDLEIVISNINEPAFIYKNKAREINSNNFIQFKFIGNQENTKLSGAKIKVRFTDGSQVFYEQMPTRGYQSAVPEVLHIGLGLGQVAGVEFSNLAARPAGAASVRKIVC